MKIKSLEFNFFGVNTYIVWDELTLEAAIVDPGMFNQKECESLVSFITDNNLKVTALINTHMHIDHVAGDDFVEEYYHVGLTAHPSDAFLGLQRDMQVMMFHLRKINTSPLEINHPVSQGDKIFLGQQYLSVIEVPGHSPGSIALYCPENDFVITGDALFDGSIGRTDLPGGNYATLIKSITDRLLTLPPHTNVYPGHGPATTIAEEISSNPFF